MTLREEIINDPLTRGYATMTNEQLLTSLRAKDRTIVVPLPSADLLIWAGANNRKRKITAGALNVAFSDDVRNACEIFNTIFQLDSFVFNVGKAAHIAMINAMVTGTVLTAVDRTALQNLATKTLSRLEELEIIDTLHPLAIAAARA